MMFKLISHAAPKRLVILSLNVHNYDTTIQVIEIIESLLGSYLLYVYSKLIFISI